MKTELISYLFLSYLTLLVSGTPQFTICPSSVCLSQPVTYECNSGDDGLTWRVLDTNGDRVGGTTVGYSEFSDVGDTGSIGSQFNTVLINNTNPLRANITFTPTLSMNNYIVQCGGAGALVDCSIVIAGIPAPVENGAIAYGAPVSTYMRYNWVSSMSPCLSHYVLVVRSTSSMDDINYNVSASSNNYTYLDLPLPSTNNTLYNFSVLTVDTGGRSSESIIRQIIFNVPGYVANLMLRQTDYPTDINETVNITVSWNPPPDSPPIPHPLFYYIIYNVSGVPQDTTVPQHISSRTLSGFTIGSEYTVGVAAVNPLGTGPTTSATISISATPTVTPPTQGTSRLGPGAIAGIVIAIIVVIGVLIILGIAIVCYVKKNNKDKDSSVTPTPPQKVEATNYAQVDHSAKLSSSKRQAPPKPPNSHSHEAVEYSAIQNSAASHNAPPPPEGTEYADLDHSASTSSGRHQGPKDTSNRVQYSHVSHHEKR